MTSRRFGAAMAFVVLAVCMMGCSGMGTAPPVTPRGALTVASPQQGGPSTRAEATDYRATSRHADVLAFLDSLASYRIVQTHAPDAQPHHVTTFGETVEGRALPLFVWGAPSADAEAIRATGKTRVLVFANIHAGEVAGKEAALMLARDLVNRHYDAWGDSLVVLIAPIYNADGNERLAPDHRRLQLGPVDGMGQRPNAQGLDLNRDFAKLRAPESRALVGLIRDADPHVVVDLHTTNGTHMGYHLTYAPGLSPNTPAAISADLFDHWLPAISDSIRASTGWETYHYGNVPGAFGERPTVPRGWYSFSAQPRFSTNYVGIRNRYAILSEAYSYAPFEERVEVTRQFVVEILNQAWANATRVRQTVEAADAESVVGETLAVRATWAPLDAPATILLGTVDTLAHPVTGDPMLQMTDTRLPEAMPAYVRFAPSETVTAPSAYLVSTTAPGAATVRDLLLDHGVRFDTTFAWGIDRERFVVDSVRVAEREFQNVRQVEAWGLWERVPAETGPMPRLAPSLRIPVDQPLGRLIVTLFEPRSDDGVIAWTLLPLDGVGPGDVLPILRIP